MKLNKISILHVILLSMTVIGLKNHVTIIPPLLEVVKRDAWMSVLLGAAIVFPWLFLLTYIHKATKGEKIRDWLTQSIGKVSTTIMMTIVSIYLILLAAFTMVETLQWVKNTFLPRTSFLLLLGIFTLLCLLLAITSIQTIVILNVFVLFFVVVFGFFVAFVNIQVKDYELLRPFLEHGVEPVVKGFVFPASGFVELFMFLFVQHEFKSKIKWIHFAIMLIILVGLTTGPLIGAITEFGPEEASILMYPAYEEWSLVSIGRYIEHLDFFSIYQWLTGTFIRVGFILFIITDLWEFRKNKKPFWFIIAPVFAFCCIGLSLLNGQRFFELKSEYFLVSTFLFFFILSFVFFFILLVTRKKKKGTASMGEGL